MKKIIFIILGFVVVAGVSFYAGMRYDQSKRKVNFSSEDRQMRFGGNAGQNVGRMIRGGDGGMVAGEILSKDEKSITVELRDGGSKIVFLSDTTQIMKTDEGSFADLVVGEQVTIMGDANADGSVSAKSVQIRPTAFVLPPSSRSTPRGRE